MGLEYMHQRCRSIKQDSVSALIYACVVMIVLFIGMTLTDHAEASSRTISIYNIHTKITLKVEYKRNGRYIPEALKKINVVMGDWRRKESTKMDPKLIDLMWEVHTELGSKRPIYLISGYRSLKTNNLLRKTRGGQAKKSRHILGKAADVHFPDISVRDLRNSAMIKQIGGVGYYPTSAIPFVHLDTGRVRHWPRMGRYELAALFPNGRTHHVPRDGKRITRGDYKIAMAKLNSGSRKAAQLALARAKIRKSDSGVRVAGLGGIPKGFTHKGKPAPGVLSSWNKKDQDAKKKQKDELDREGLLRLASLNPGKDDSLAANSKGAKSITDADNATSRQGRWVSAPEYDDDHDDELSYSPFPVLPLMSDTSVSYDTKIIQMVAPAHDKVEYLMGEPTKMIPLRFRPGLQYSQMLWASDFQGKAVKNIMENSAGQRQRASDIPQYPKHHLEALEAQRKAKKPIVARN